MRNTIQFKTPGQLIQALLDERGWSQRVLAVVLNVSETGINKIIAGKQSLDAPMALALADVLDISAENLLELQKSYELAEARIRSIEDPALANRAQLFGSLPIPDMVKRGWISVADLRDFASVKSALVKFFHVETIDQIETVFPHAAKKTNVAGKVTPIQLAWLYRVKEISAEMLTARFSMDAVRAALLKLKPLLKDKDSVKKVPRILQDCGIRYVIVEALPGAKIDGVCLWLDAKKPVIAMSLRYDRIDNFWFVLRHEIEHVLCGHGRDENTMMLDSELESENEDGGHEIADEEQVANEAATEFCVPQKALSDFMARKAPFFADRDIVGFSGIYSIHPGLIAGQLRRRLKRYDRFQIHLAKVRSAIIPSALVDGFGNFVPVGE